MSVNIEPILESIAARKGRARNRIGLKSSYLGALSHCWSGGHCPEKLFRSAPSGDALAKLMKEAERELTFGAHQIDATKDVRNPASGSKSICDLEIIITTTRRDRDRDILDTKGAMPDKNMPLLWQHVPWEPIGKLYSITEHSNKRLKGLFGIADTELGRDAATLVEFGALRSSHGFMPLDYEPIEEKGEHTGWLIKSFEIMENSLVSIPSNTDSVITAFSRDKLHHPAVKQWAKGQFQARAKVFSGADLFSKSEHTDTASPPPAAPQEDSASEPAPCACKSKPVNVGEVEVTVKLVADIAFTSSLEALNEGKDLAACRKFYESFGARLHELESQRDNAEFWELIEGNY